MCEAVSFRWRGDRHLGTGAGREAAWSGGAVPVVVPPCYLTVLCARMCALSMCLPLPVPRSTKPRGPRLFHFSLSRFQVC